MEKFPWQIGHVRLSARYRRERFAVEASMGGKGGKGDKSVLTVESWQFLVRKCVAFTLYHLAFCSLFVFQHSEVFV